jgi:hypothetical protein
MGTWGTGLYSDDTACDVRDDYRDILGDGVIEPQATKQIIEQWKTELDDPVFWLSLADVQWKLGRLQENVKKQALEIIENGTDLARWSSDKKLKNKRKAVLDHLAKKLISDQPAEKKIPKRYVDSTDWNLGDVYSFQLKSGNYALLHVIGFNQDKGGRGPVCAILDWYGREIPDKASVDAMEYRYANEANKHLCQFLFGSLSAKDYKKERVNLLFQNIKSKQKLGGYSVILWRMVDKQFETLFGLI